MEKSNKLKLTEKRLMEIANRTVTKTQRIYDTQVRGLTLKLTPFGHKTFEVYKKAKSGKSPVTVKICQYGDMSLEQIRSEAYGHPQTLRQGKNPNLLLREITRSDKTLQDALDWYAKTKTGTIENHTLLQYRRAIANYTPTLLSKRLSDITTEEIISSYQRIVDGKCDWRRDDGSTYKMRKLSPSQANLWFRAMRAIINLAIDSCVIVIISRS